MIWRIVEGVRLVRELVGVIEEGVEDLQQARAALVEKAQRGDLDMALNRVMKLKERKR